jgi:chromosome segregation ATPase
MSDEEYPCDPGYCQILELHQHIKALTEQLEAARADAKEAEAYAMELERDLKTCRMAQVVMDNTVAELERERDRWREIANNEAVEGEANRNAGLALEAKLAKAVEALWEWDDLIKHQYSGSREAMSDMTYAAQHTAALLAEIEGEK